MTLEQAKEAIKPLIGVKFGDLFDDRQLNRIIIEKGKSGKLLEKAIGLTSSINTLDFDDGELKTNKCNKNGNPIETIFITMISSMIDDLINLNTCFYDSILYKKIKNFLYVPICKEGDPKEWHIMSYIHVNLSNSYFSYLREFLKNDYENICRQLKNHIETSKDGFIHTSNGKYIQIRSKDSKPYHPIYSETYKRYVSNKNHAFYFKKPFVYEIKKLVNLI